MGPHCNQVREKLSIPNDFEIQGAWPPLSFAYLARVESVISTAVIGV